jgi:hypothetical protein
MRSARVRAIYVPVTEPMRRALVNLAEREFRDPRDQAAYLITEGLRAAGALPESKTAPAEPATATR